jgi:hypothetical protein
MGSPTTFEPNFALVLAVTQPRYLERGNSLCRVLAPSLAYLAHASVVLPRWPHSALNGCMSSNNFLLYYGFFEVPRGTFLCMMR